MRASETVFSPKTRKKLCHFEDGVAALLHEPAGGAGGTTDADGLDVFEPGGLDLAGVFDEMAVGVHPQTLIEEHLAVRTLPTADEENHVVFRGETGDVRHAVGYRATDGVETLERGPLGDMRLDVVDDPMELIERLRGLGVEVDVAGEVEFHHFVEVLDDDGFGFGLADKTEYLSVAFLTENHYLGHAVGGILFLMRFWSWSTTGQVASMISMLF